MEYYVKDMNTKRVVLVTAKTHRALGGNYVRVKAPAKRAAAPSPPIVEEEVFAMAEKKEAVEPQKELITKDDYLEALRAAGKNRKGLHLFSLEKLKEMYESDQ